MSITTTHTLRQLTPDPEATLGASIPSFGNRVNAASILHGHRERDKASARERIGSLAALSILHVLARIN